MGSFIAGMKAILEAIGDIFEGLKRIDKLLRRLLRDIVRAVRLMGQGRDRGGCCINLPSTVLKRADPLIYDQYYLMGMGLSVTWDNPDIQLYQGGVAVPPGTLDAGATYDVRIRVWNGSYDAPAVGLPVLLSFLSFGIGTPSTAVGSAMVDLGVKGSASAPAFASIPWTTPTTPGHYCLQVHLIWPDDANPDNNLGQKNTNVGVAHSPAVLTFDVRNDATVPRVFTFEVDSYQIPFMKPCPRHLPPRDAGRGGAGQGRLAESKARWAEAIAEWGYGKAPLAPGWTVTFDPARPTLAAGEQITVEVSAEPPAGAAPGRYAVNVHGFAEPRDRRRVLAGGVTLFVDRS